MGKHKHFKSMGLGKAEINTIPKTWEKWILLLREKYGKNRHSKVMGLSIVLGEAEIYTIPKTWGKWISIKPEKHGKLNISNLLFS